MTPSSPHKEISQIPRGLLGTAQSKRERYWSRSEQAAEPAFGLAVCLQSLPRPDGLQRVWATLSPRPSAVGALLMAAVPSSPPNTIACAFSPSTPSVLGGLFPLLTPVSRPTRSDHLLRVHRELSSPL